MIPEIIICFVYAVMFGMIANYKIKIEMLERKVDFYRSKALKNQDYKSKLDKLLKRNLMKSEKEIRARYKKLKKSTSPSDMAGQDIISELEWILQIPSKVEKWQKSND
tara:strand:+ start:1993 stop:2316 length:324 start_codon:yes stop_codon:yes gene_type:complete